MKFPVSLFLILTLCSFIIVISTIEPAAEYILGSEYEVRVINGFTDNSSLPLVIWCASEDADLGGRALQEHDDFSWKMKTGFWSSNCMTCTMKWDQIRKRFEAFKASRDNYRCGPLKRCFWMVTQNGFYFSNDEVNWNKDFSW
ncbi:hypothetical protein L6164_013156 [Bauhinia variegata]|uniref:Uncharacterized protein n=1 Tax=Bauhinia variegata TaxID=167791 RepID=A0ACB9PDN2_BAUVA|nr:hypothetical protein L6164_013156 [Bauhinia variegata]